MLKSALSVSFLLPLHHGKRRGTFARAWREAYIGENLGVGTMRPAEEGLFTQ